MNPVADGGTEHIQNQVINVAAAHQREKLEDLNCRDEDGGGHQNLGQGNDPPENPGQQKSQGEEQDDVAPPD